MSEKLTIDVDKFRDVLRANGYDGEIELALSINYGDWTTFTLTKTEAESIAEELVKRLTTWTAKKTNTPTRGEGGKAMAKKSTTDIIQPALSLLVKLGSIAVHADEMLSPRGHDFDKQELLVRLRDPEVVAWLKEMDRLALVPKKR